MSRTGKTREDGAYSVEPNPETDLRELEFFMTPEGELGQKLAAAAFA